MKDWIEVKEPMTGRMRYLRVSSIVSICDLDENDAPSCVLHIAHSPNQKLNISAEDFMNSLEENDEEIVEETWEDS
jgi:hypothetical protein